jgi:hypothetical protein
MINKDDVLSAVKAKGYVIPSDVSKQFAVDTFIMGAMLSDLVSEKKLFVSTVKIGGSPVYYAPEAKEKLQELFKYLNEKDKQTYLLLQEHTVIPDAGQQPLVRVSLRNLKDYAKPLDVVAQGTTQLFWKWYLATDEEINAKISSLLSPKQEVKQEIQEEKLISKAAKIKKPKEQQQSLPVVPDDVFVQQILSFFSEKNITVTDAVVIKKGEVDCIVHIPSAVGTIDYFCKAKNKKKCTEGEIASAFVAAQLKKLPALFLTTGEVSKKIKLQDYANMKLLTMG